jgi:hypothetical protein
MTHGVIMRPEGNGRYCDRDMYVSGIATSADRVPEVRVLIPFPFHILVLNELMILHVVPWHRTDSVIDRMILYTISTGLVTSVLSCILLGMVHFDDFHLFFTVIMLMLN